MHLAGRTVLAAGPHSPNASRPQRGAS